MFNLHYTFCQPKIKLHSMGIFTTSHRDTLTHIFWESNVLKSWVNHVSKSSVWFYTQRSKSQLPLSMTKEKEKKKPNPKKQKTKTQAANQIKRNVNVSSWNNTISRQTAVLLSTHIDQ